MLKTVTFTGIDNRTNMKELEKLQKEYPFVEFGLLVSVTNTNNNINNRYPNLSILDKIKPETLRLALHTCGMAARVAVQKNDWIPFYDLMGDYLSYFSRVQLNVATQKKFSEKVSFPKGFDFIIQSNTSNMAMYETYKHVDNIYGFQDNSGGLGKEETLWIPSNDSYFGYAGGINEDNVLQVILSISNVCKGDFWIDMESSLRTNDWFDIDKCRRICEKIKRNN